MQLLVLKLLYTKLKSYCHVGLNLNRNLKRVLELLVGTNKNFDLISSVFNSQNILSSAT